MFAKPEERIDIEVGSIIVGNCAKTKSFREALDDRVLIKHDIRNVCSGLRLNIVIDRIRAKDHDNGNHYNQRSDAEEYFFHLRIVARGGSLCQQQTTSRSDQA